jgi:hypothetical protein
MRRHVVRVRVDVDETRREHEALRVQALASIAGWNRSIRTMRPSRIPTSPMRAGAPVPSMMRAFAITEIERLLLRAARRHNRQDQKTIAAMKAGVASCRLSPWSAGQLADNHARHCNRHGPNDVQPEELDPGERGDEPHGRHPATRPTNAPWPLARLTPIARTKTPRIDP